MSTGDGGGGGHFPYCGDSDTAVAAAIQSLDSQRDATHDLARRSAAQLPKVRAAWPQGAAGDTAYATLRMVDDFVPKVAPALDSAAHALTSYQSDLRAGRRHTDELNSAYAALAPLQERVATFGSWIEPRQEAAYDSAMTELRVAAARVGFASTQDIDAAYHGVVMRVTSARDACAAELAALARQQQLPQGRPGMSTLAAGLAGSLTLTQLLTRAGFSGMPSSAADVKRFWDTLSPTERQQLLAADPQLWGNCNGVPCVDRDYANRIVLTAELGELDAVFAGHGWPPPRSVADIENLTADQLYALGWGPRPGDLINLNEAGTLQMERFKDALSVSEALRKGPDGGAFLLAYDSAAFHGEGRAAIAFGENPDVAANIAVCVPGLESRVSKMGDLSGDAWRLLGETANVEPTTTTSVIAWQGYDAPEFANVASQGKAEAGARLLAADMAALDVTHNGDPRLTVVAHSYGTTTTGLSLQREGLAGSVDQVILIGSPGVGGSAHTVGDLGLRPDQLYVGSASRDVVTTDYATLGANPAFDDFGGTRFKAENVDRQSGLPWQTADHSLYYDNSPTSESLRSMADIVAGRGDQLSALDLVAQPRQLIPTYGGDNPYPVVIDPESMRAPKTYGH